MHSKIKIKEITCCGIGLIAGIALALFYWGAKYVSSIWVHDMVFSGLLLGLCTSLTLISNSKKWPAVTTAIPLVGSCAYVLCSTIISSYQLSRIMHLGEGHFIWLTPMVKYSFFALIMFSVSGLVGWYLGSLRYKKNNHENPLP